MNSPLLVRWLGRLVVVAVIALFTMVGLKFVIDPVSAASGSGFSLASAVGFTNARAGIGGFPLSIAALLAFCLVSGRQRLGLGFIATVSAIILSLRLFSATHDGTFLESLHIIVPELVILALALLALGLERSTRAARTPS